jgi:UDP-N-acetylglucosamine--N-acetylmuramyl-(pentapeptide) pyrophosphoryl-undecaprenol N-acetylglucosamine transferase
MSGGGTAGHIYPALTVAEGLADAGHDVRYVGTPEGLEARLVPEAGVEFVGIAARGYDRARPHTLVTSSAAMAASTRRARSVIADFAADVVAGFGGYVSIPVGAAAVVKRTPLVLFEQNSVPGMANTFLSRWARSVGITYPVSAGYLRRPELAVVTGNPVRGEVLAGDRARGRSSLGVPDDARMLLVFGGSRGARRINDATVEIAPLLLERHDLHIVHIAGPAEHEAVAERVASSTIDESRYHLFDYIHSMGSVIAAADLVISRAGATSIAELTALGVPAVLVPYPHATDDHQTLNADAVADAGGAVRISDDDVDSVTFLESVSELLDDSEARATMAGASGELGRPDATQRVMDLIVEIAAGRRPHLAEDDE